VEAAGGSVVVICPESDQEPRGCEMAARFERKTDGKRVELQRNWERGVGFLFKGRTGKRRVLHLKSKREKEFLRWKKKYFVIIRSIYSNKCLTY